MLRHIATAKKYRGHNVQIASVSFKNYLETVIVPEEKP